MPPKPIKLSSEESERDPESKRLLINLKIVFKRYIQKRDKYRCVLNSEIRNISLSHYFGAAGSPNEAMAYNEKNVHMMSNRLHREYHEVNPLPYTRFMTEKYGIEELERMEKESQKKKRLSKQEIVELTNHYAKLTKSLGEVNRLKEYKAKKAQK